MSYRLYFTKQAQTDIDYHKNSGNQAVLKKVLSLLEELTNHPLTGTGKPEALKYTLSGLWSRKINQEHRLVYEIKDDKVIIHSVKGHYLL